MLDPILSRIAIQALALLAWAALLVGILGAISTLSAPSPVIWLWLFAGVLAWALLTVFAAVADKYLSSE